MPGHYCWLSSTNSTEETRNVLSNNTVFMGKSQFYPERFIESISHSTTPCFPRTLSTTQIKVLAIIT